MGVVLSFIALFPKHQPLVSLTTEAPYYHQTLVQYSQCLSLLINTNKTKNSTPSLPKMCQVFRKQRTSHP